MDNHTPTLSRKRSSTSVASESRNPQNIKRQRTSTDLRLKRKDKDATASASGPEGLPTAPTPALPSYFQVDKSTAEDVGRDGLQRSIALALQHVGFDGASREAMESFTEVADTCTFSLAILSRLLGYLTADHTHIFLQIYRDSLSTSRPRHMLREEKTQPQPTTRPCFDDTMFHYHT